VASFQRSLLGYRRRDVDVALAAREREIKALNDCLTGAEMELAEAEAALESRRRELARHSVRIAELDRTATLLAERVVERQRELRVARAELEIHSRSTRAEVSRSDRGSRQGGTAGAKPVTGGNGIPSPSREAGGAGVSDRQNG
jgi:chromosome segregation ATPase